MAQPVGDCGFQAVEQAVSYLTNTAPLLPVARALVIKHQRGSISLVQRYLRIGYNAASELLEQLERDGVCGQLGQFGGRDVLIRSADMTDADKAALRTLDEPSENDDMAQTTAERQKAFKAAQKAAGLVRLEAYVTKDQRIKFRALGGDPWLRKKIDRAKVKT
jgi:DNA segregation ATPase FtsK/SpoIIIE-like protein